MQILRIQEVIKKTGLSRSNLYDMVRKGEFPAPLKLGERASGWLVSEVEAWIEELAKKRGVA